MVFVQWINCATRFGRRVDFDTKLLQRGTEVTAKWNVGLVVPESFAGCEIIVNRAPIEMIKLRDERVPIPHWILQYALRRELLLYSGPLTPPRYRRPCELCEAFESVLGRPSGISDESIGCTICTSLWHVPCVLFLRGKLGIGNSVEVFRCHRCIPRDGTLTSVGHVVAKTAKRKR